MSPPHWRYLANMIELLLLSAHPSPIDNPNGKSIGSAISAQLTTEVQYFTMCDPSPRIALLMGGLDPYLTYDSLGHIEPTTRMASRLVQPFSHR